MAYTAVVSKESVTNVGEKLFRIDIKLVVLDGATTIFEATANAIFNSVTMNINDVKNTLLTDLAKSWDTWESEKLIYNSSSLDNMISSIETSATEYIN